MKKRVRINYKRLGIVILVIVLIVLAIYLIVKFVNDNRNKKKMASYGFDTMYVTDGKYVTYNEAKKMVLSAAFNTTDEQFYTSYGIEVDEPIYGWSQLSNVLGIPTVEYDTMSNVTEEIVAEYIVNVLEIVLEKNLEGENISQKATKLGLNGTGRLLKKTKLNAWIVTIFENYGSLHINNDMQITTSNKPSNADIYPYIVDGIDKRVYEKITDNMSELPKEAYLKYSNSYMQIKEVVEDYFNIILNVDYETIYKDKLISALQWDLAYSIYTMLGDDYVYLQDIENYVEYVKQNNIKLSGKATTLFPIFYGAGNAHYLRVKCEFEILEKKTNSNVLLYDNGKEYTNSKYVIYVDVPLICVSVNGTFKIKNEFSIWSYVVIEEVS